MKRWIVFLPLLVVAALSVLFAGYALHHDPTVKPAALVGKPTPDLTLPTLDTGMPVKLRSAAQGPSFINVFASWCAPCVQENPALLALKAQGARIVGLAYKDELPASRAFLAKLGDPFTTVLVDRDGRAGIELGISGVPETFLVAADGTILAKHIGPITPDVADSLMERAQKGR
jgi:cytochrome c biogenesis protein CcmG/thiol:disulfide interchange protein DsbE